MSPGITTLDLAGVSRRFGQVTALDGLSMTITGGEFIALLGPSGCGKSTALNCLAGLLPLTAGRITLDGKRMDTQPAERRGFGMVFQNYALFPHLTVERNVAFGLRMRKVPKADVRSRVRAALELVHLEHLARSHPGQLSGGQQQRVAIARAVVLRPPLVLMDEPLSNLDAKLRVEMRTEIKRLHQELGLTTIYVTHDQEEALSLADRLVLMKDGQVQQIGTPEELYAQPVSPFVADFMGFRNQIAGTATDTGFTFDDGTWQGRSTVTGAAVAMCRPEDLRVDIEHNAIKVTVEVVEYHGRQFLLEVRTTSGLKLHAVCYEPHNPGDEVRIGITPDRLLVFEP
ncbi:ABC transporter ATP-binding protein [Actinocrispum wychmicini]|uniref:Putative spermidine/putrescine transport system ATP-binding protein n=1 Tax=Actinocrispum wychmicini TaxID=1213861 RepID=A0A4R2KD49_9PSEU|nr:ABC transporter ATP-binding protein [Actinocrispum wychmicini]TCO64435.1 putative spermidine/putrescine transport system ATP-binding protein [Actinocrispum wychmicini]